MIKKVLAVLFCFVLILSLGACKKKETQPAPQVPGPMAPGPMPPGPMMQGPMAQQGQPGGMMMPKGKTVLQVPDFVKGKLSAARIILEDKMTKKKLEYTVKLNSDFPVPNSDLKITVGEFIPDFRMNGLNLTSASNQPNNPALAIRVFEGGKQIFPAPGKQWGWLFAKVPAIHPFEHQKYGIFLKEGVKKG
jgi:hypothetical protein